MPFIGNIKIDIDAEKFTEGVKIECDKAAKKAAEKIMGDSKAFIAQHAKHPTGKLASQIELKASKYRGGGWAIQAQGPGNYEKYYAVFVELGHISTLWGKRTGKKGGNPGPYVQPLPYLRNPLAANKNYILNQFKDLI